MVSRWYLACYVFLLAAFWLAPSTSALQQRAAGGNEPIAVRTATVNGLKLQYLTAGHGPAVLLLHGYAETSRMWRALIPRLAPNFTVIAPDYRASVDPASRRTVWT
jgi:alpha-beta hydrolase superfamily lysophospholipase